MEIMAPFSLATDLMLEVMARTDFVHLVRCAATCKHLRRDILRASLICRITRQCATSILCYLSSYEDQSLVMVHPITPAAESFYHGHILPFLSRCIGNLLGQYCPVASRGSLVVLYRMRVKIQPKYMHCFDLCVYNLMTGHPTFLPKASYVHTYVSSSQQYVFLNTADGIPYSFFLKRKSPTPSCCLSLILVCKFPWGSISRYSDPAILVDAVMHWLVDHGNQILTYDMGTGMPGLVNLPPTKRDASQLHLAMSVDGKLLKLLPTAPYSPDSWWWLGTGNCDRHRGEATAIVP